MPLDQGPSHMVERNRSVGLRRCRGVPDTLYNSELSGYHMQTENENLDVVEGPCRMWDGVICTGELKLLDEG
jgi:hypothetical protein